MGDVELKVQNMGGDIVKLNVKYKTTMKDAGVHGVLMMTMDYFEFMPVSGSGFHASFKSIKSHRASKVEPSKPPLLNLIKHQGSIGYIFEFETYSDRDFCRDFVHIRAGIPKSVSQECKQQGVGCKRTYFDEETEKQIELLQRDSSLGRLFEQLVVTEKILTCDEFWESRKKLLGVDNNGYAQQLGPPNASMVLDIKPLTNGRVTFNLTPKVIRQIFAEKPVVCQAFLDYVPHKISEKDFWSKYCRAQYLRSSENVMAAVAEAEEDEELALFFKRDDIVASEVRRKIRKVDPTLNMLADQWDDGISHVDAKEGIKSDLDYDLYRKDLSKDLNRHAEVVLEGRLKDVELKDTRTLAEALARLKRVELVEEDSNTKANKEQLTRIARMIEIDDLEASYEHQLAPLCIKDPREYFYYHQVNVHKTLGNTTSEASPVNHHISTDDALVSLRKSISELNYVGFIDIKPELAVKVLNDLTCSISITKQRPNHSSFQDEFPSILKEELLNHWASIEELLKHFWSKYPDMKVKKLIDGMKSMHTKLLEIKESVQLDFRHSVSVFIQPMIEAMDAAFKHYHDLQM